MLNGGADSSSHSPAHRWAGEMLTSNQLIRCRPYASEKQHAAGEMIYEIGTRAADLLIVLDGSLTVIAADADGEEIQLATLHRGQFAGEHDLLDSRASLIGVRVAERATVLHIAHARLHQITTAELDVADVILRTIMRRHETLLKDGRVAALVVGPGTSSQTMYTEEFLRRNGYPSQLIDTDKEKLSNYGVHVLDCQSGDLPAVIVRDQVYRDPGPSTLADALGLSELPQEGELFDVAIIGAGPAGLSASVYAASEGLKTIVIEGLAPGGQAGTSSRIENYLGFPVGISGENLASLAQVQAQKFGTRFSISRKATGLTRSGDSFVLTLEGGGSVAARSVIIASGARYRKLKVSNYVKFEGCGLLYAATAIEARSCEQEDVVVVGGGNSAGQAADYLSESARCVYLIVRGDNLSKSMSEYLVGRVEANPKISVQLFSEITELHGDSALEKVVWVDRETQAITERAIRSVFIMIGADPCTAWLSDTVQLDEKGFICTDSSPTGTSSAPFQTSMPGVYAVGDVRSGSVKRVAASVGEGSVVVSSLYQYLTRRRRA